MKLAPLMNAASPTLAHIRNDWEAHSEHSFAELSAIVLHTHQYSVGAATRSINRLATLRNWLIGCYIVEYEQKGRDRAQYGERLLKRLEERVDCKGLNETLFKVSRSFYVCYPQLRELFEEGKSATPSHQFVTGAFLVGTVERAMTTGCSSRVAHKPPKLHLNKQ